MTTFAELLRHHRHAAGLTQQALATRIGVPMPTLRGWESGRTRPRMERLPALAAGLGVAVDDLMPTTTKPSARKPN